MDKNGGCRPQEAVVQAGAARSVSVRVAEHECGERVCVDKGPQQGQGRVRAKLSVCLWGYSWVPGGLCEAVLMCVSAGPELAGTGVSASLGGHVAAAPG